MAAIRDLGQALTTPTKGAILAAPTALTALTPLIGGPARRVVVGGISGTVVLTQLDGTTLTISAAMQTLLGGVIEHVCTHVQSAAGTDILVQT